MSLHHCVLAALLVVGGSSSADAEDLSFAAALERAAREAPSVQADVSRVEAARQEARAAGRLPDPKLLLGIDNFPVSGPDQYTLSNDAMTMRRIGMMQDFPSRAKRSAESALAQGQINLAQSELRITRLMAQEQVAAAWIARWTLERQLVKLDELDAENRLLAAAVRTRIAASQGQPVEAVTVRQEAAVLAERRDALGARREQAIARLKRWIGPAADAPLFGGVPVLLADRLTLLGNVSQHPTFAALDARAAVMDSEIASARAARHPDWSIEMAYQKRAPVFGDMISLQLSVDLPVLAGSRQIPRIEAKRAERHALDAEREAGFREHKEMIEADLAEEQRLQKAVVRQRDVVLPLAEEKIALLQSAWRANKADLADLIGARRERIEAQIMLLELEGAEQAEIVGLYLRYHEHELGGQQ